MDRKKLEREARQLCRNFSRDVQAVFDDPDMTNEIYDSGLFVALLEAQQAADEAADYDA